MARSVGGMYIVCAPDSFKGSMTAPQAAAAMAVGIREVLPTATVVELPIADGGEGFTQAVIAATTASRVEVRVHDQAGNLRPAHYALTDEARTAVLEGAASSGLDLVAAPQRDIMAFDTRGLGEMIRHALDSGVSRITIGIGGSSTNDFGAGMLAALGARFLDDSGDDLPPSPQGLERLHRVDLSGLDPRLAAVTIEVACDVTNPLLGPTGAAAVYGPQKGADPATVTRLDAIGARLLEVLGSGAQQAAATPGAGAAGGLGWALHHVLGAHLRPGFELVADLVGLDAHLARADLVLGAEGSVDSQTPHGKAMARLCDHAQRAGVPVIVFGGRVDLAADALPGQVRLVCITPPGQPLDEALRQGPENLRVAVAAALT